MPPLSWISVKIGEIDPTSLPDRSKPSGPSKQIGGTKILGVNILTSGGSLLQLATSNLMRSFAIRVVVSVSLRRRSGKTAICQQELVGDPQVPSIRASGSKILQSTLN